MLQTRIISGITHAQVESELNEALSEIDSNSVTIKWPDSKCLVAVIEYEVEDANTSAICVDCRFFDDSNSKDGLIGLCQQKGKRVRFSCHACQKFTDVRA